MDFNVVQWASENLGKLLPWRVIYDYERGVRWTFGLKPKALNPGLRLCAPWHRVEQFTVVEQIINLPTQSVMTKDKVAVCFSVNVGIKISDPVAHFCAVKDFDQSVRDLAMSHLSARVRGCSLDQLTGETGLRDLERSLQGTMSTRLEKWGTEVTHVGFTDFVPVTNQMRLFQDKPGSVL